jgi:hypothetical protein
MYSVPFIYTMFLAPLRVRVREGYYHYYNMCLIINNQPFERGCHGCDLVRVNLVIAVMAIQQWPCGWCLGDPDAHNNCQVTSI